MSGKKNGKSTKSTEISGGSSEKRRGRVENLKPFKKGQSGNPGGRPKKRNSITYWFHEIGNMTPVEVSELCTAYAAQLRKGGDGLPIFGIIAVRALMELMNDPASNVLSTVLDRTEGKVSQPIEINDWRTDARHVGIDPDVLVEQFAEMVEAGAEGDGAGDNPG